MGFINTASTPAKIVAPLPDTQASAEVDSRVKPFLSSGFVSISADSEKVQVTILHDTAAYHSFILASVLPLSDETSCFSDLLVWGIK